MMKERGLCSRAVLTLIFSFVLVGSLFAENTISQKAELYTLYKNQWDGSQTWLESEDWYGIIGGYLRSDSVPEDQEMLLNFNLNNLEGRVTSARLSFKVSGGNGFGSYTEIGLYEQNRTTNDVVLSYNSFEGTQWDNLLSEEVAHPQKDEYIDLESPELINQIQKWIDNPETNKGLVLTANMYHSEYHLMITDVTLSVVVEGDNELRWKAATPHNFNTYESGALSPFAMETAPDGTVYVAHRTAYQAYPGDSFSHIGMKVLKYSNNTWELVGELEERVHLSSFLDLELGNNGELYLSYASHNSDRRVQVKKFDGTTWSNVGGFVSEGSVDHMGSEIECNPVTGELYVSYFSNMSTHVKKFNGTDWESVGMPLGNYSNGYSQRPTLAFASDGTLYTTFNVTAFMPLYVSTLVVKSVENGWETVGDRIEEVLPQADGSYSEAYMPKLAIGPNDIPYVTFFQIDGGKTKLFVKKYLMNEWTLVNHILTFDSNGAFLPQLEITSNNVPQILYIDNDTTGYNANTAVILQDLGDRWGTYGNNAYGEQGFETAGVYDPVLKLTNGDVPFIFYCGEGYKPNLKYFSK